MRPTEGREEERKRGKKGHRDVVKIYIYKKGESV